MIAILLITIGVMSFKVTLVTLFFVLVMTPAPLLATLFVMPVI